MAIETKTWAYGAQDCQIAVMLTDPAGGPATYSPQIDIPGVKTVTISGDVNTTELRGDHSLLDTNSVLTNITVSVTHAMLGFEALEALLGGTEATGGTGTTEYGTFDLAGDDTLPYFMLSARTPDGGATLVGGDLHYTLYKLKLSSFPEMGLAEEDYQTFSFEARAIPRVADDKWINVRLNETAAAIDVSS